MDDKNGQEIWVRVGDGAWRWGWKEERGDGGACRVQNWTKDLE